MNNRIVKAEKSIQASCNKMGITETGRRWLETVTDPFKDLPIKPEGYPDQIMSPSCVQIVKEQFTVSTVSGSSNWDCNLIMDCIPMSFPLTQTNNVVPVAGATIGNAFNLVGQNLVAYRGGMVVRQGVAGSLLNNVTANLPINGSSINPAFWTNTDTRVIAQGFEVHNVTNELNVSGAVTVWRTPRIRDAGAKVASLFYNAPSNNGTPTAVEWITIEEPPETASAALLMPGSATWEAREGAYVVPVMSSPINTPGPLQTLLVSSQDDGGGPTWTQPFSSGGASNITYLNSQLYLSPFAIQGAYFTGLSPQTVLTVNVIYVVERFADDQASDLATLSRPSAVYDPMALKVYSEVARQMPPGVRVAENGLGAWVSGIASVVSNVAKHFGPIGTAVSAIAEEFVDKPVYRAPPIPTYDLPPPNFAQNLPLPPPIYPSVIVESVATKPKVVQKAKKKRSRKKKTGTQVVNLPPPVYSRQGQDYGRPNFAPNTNSSVHYNQWAPPRQDWGGRNNSNYSRRR